MVQNHKKRKNCTKKKKYLLFFYAFSYWRGTYVKRILFGPTWFCDSLILNQFPVVLFLVLFIEISKYLFKNFFSRSLNILHPHLMILLIQIIAKLDDSGSCNIFQINLLMTYSTVCYIVKSGKLRLTVTNASRILKLSVRTILQFETLLGCSFQIVAE